MEGTGSGPGDIRELRQSRFFQPLDFDKVYRKEITPIYKPNLGSATDVANFDPTFTNEEAKDSHIDTTALKGTKNQFEGFTIEDRGELGR